MRHQLSRILTSVLLLVSAISATSSDSTPQPANTIAWQPWSDSLFSQAKREHKFVLLDLQAVWCHWCHVMDEKTYSDPRVIALIKSNYIAVRIDQDSRPDLANRYQDYGWPATVVFNADGGEIVKRQGFFPPEQMTSMLQAIIDDPTPGPSVTSVKSIKLGGTLAASDLDLLKKQLADGYDWKLGGWGVDQKFLNWDNVEYCLVQARTGDQAAEKKARQTLTAQLQIIDPVWGGVDQYSADGDWNHPHFEKIMQFQAENMRIYAEAYALWKDPVYLKTAQGIYGYVRGFLTDPDGVVYVSQDADLVPGEHGGDYFKLDDAGRRKLGIPRIDKHIYARENGWFIQGLTALTASTGDVRYRDEAVRAAEWIIQNRTIPGGGFRHGVEKSGPISLGDTLSIGRAFLSLYTVTADPAWLDRASQAATFIDQNFAYHVNGAAIGYATAADEPATSMFAPGPDFDENVSLARFANLLFHYTGNDLHKRIAETALRFPATPEIAKARPSSVGSLLLAEQELATDPLHVAIVGKKSDPIARQLFETVLAYPVIYKQVEWIDHSEKSSLADADLYPDMSRAAAYTCSNGACSSPVFDQAHLTALLNRKTAGR